MTADELLRMPLQNEILVLRGQKPLLMQKHDFTRHPLSNKLIPKPVSEYVPDWVPKHIKEDVHDLPGLAGDSGTKDKSDKLVTLKNDNNAEETAKENWSGWQNAIRKRQIRKAQSWL